MRWLSGVAAFVVVSLWQDAYAQPDQKPLLSRQVAAKPNVMLTMDDSGSMRFQNMPEDTVHVGSYSVGLPASVAGYSVVMVPGDPERLGTHFVGAIAATPGSGNWRQKILRSPDANTIYYNPEISYQPWPKAHDVGRMSPADPAAAPYDPTDPIKGGTVNLTVLRNSKPDKAWCFADLTTDCSITSTEMFDPGLYYRLKKGSGGSYLDPDRPGSYDEYSINSASSFPQARVRADCKTVAGQCNQAEERQNFANWFTYYRSRRLMAKGAVAGALSEQGNEFRLGYGRINQANSTCIRLGKKGECLEYVVNSIDGVGTSVLNAGLRDFDSTTKSGLLKWLYALPAEGGTPLRGAIQAVGQYYMRNDAKGPWTDDPSAASNTVSNNKTCRRAYNMLVTDGYWNGDEGLKVGNQDGTSGSNISGLDEYVAAKPYSDSYENTLADVAMKYWKNDLMPNMANNVEASLGEAADPADPKSRPIPPDPAKWQHMTTFTVSLGLRGTLDPATDLEALTAGSKRWRSDKIDDLWHAAVNSRGIFRSAEDPAQLTRAISAALKQITERELREAGVATASATLSSDNRKYIPSYQPDTWVGDVQAFKLDANGVAGAQVWNAVSKLPVWNQRNIYTWDVDRAAPTGVAFDWASLGDGLKTRLGPLASRDLVDYLRGDGSKEEGTYTGPAGAGLPYRKRGAPLGDFVNSAPVMVKGLVDLGYGNLSIGGAGYPSFVASKKARTGVLFVGGNGGMLHGFKDTNGAAPLTDGEEVFAYVPAAVYPHLSKLADKTYGTAALYHRYYVDGQLLETDAFVKAPGAGASSWRNYLLGSLGAGGRAVYALDVTDSPSLNASSIRWELSGETDVDLGHVFAPLEAGVLPNGEWVAVFGNGYSSSTGSAALFVVNLQTGAARKVVVDNSGNNGLGGVVAQRGTAGEITALYAGDLKGKLWKFEYDDAQASRFKISGGAAFFSATSSNATPQPISQAPVLYDHPEGGKTVVFGTGVLITEADANSKDVQSIYAVWDKASDTVSRPMTRDQLTGRTVSPVSGAKEKTYYSVSGDAVNWASTTRGWRIDLDFAAGLRVIYPLQALSWELALISAVMPAQNTANTAVCKSASWGVNFVIPVQTGVNPGYKLFDVNGDAVYDGSDAYVAGYSTGGDGRDAIVQGGGQGPCPDGFHPASINSAYGQEMACIPDKKDPLPRSIKDRVWRRLINPPIR
jgi:type IV pilus assembly protein PilY1